MKTKNFLFNGTFQSWVQAHTFSQVKCMRGYQKNKSAVFHFTGVKTDYIVLRRSYQINFPRLSGTIFAPDAMRASPVHELSRLPLKRTGRYCNACKDTNVPKNNKLHAYRYARI